MTHLSNVDNSSLHSQKTNKCHFVTRARETNIVFLTLLLHTEVFDNNRL
jgi:hypothetical protein